MEEKMEKKPVQTRWEGFCAFIKLMKVDLIIVFFCFSVAMQGVSVTQLAEDKMCINQLNQPKEYCLTLNTNHSTEENAHIVLRHASTIRQWQTFIMNIPATIGAAFLGFWLDKYPQYFKMMMVLPLAAGSLELIVMLLNAFFFKISSWAILASYIPLGLGGGYLTIFGAAYTYITWSTPTHLLIIRFAVLECVTQSAILLATYIGGKVLAMEPFIDGQVENYIGTLSLSLICSLIAMIMALTFTFDGALKPAPELANLTHGQVIKDVFKLSRIVELFKTVLRKRPKNGRVRLVMLVLSATLCLSSIHGEDSISLQYAQSVYNWSPEQYTKLYSVVNIVPAIATALGPQLLSSVFKLPDSSSGIIGTASLFAMNLIRGTILNPTGFALAAAFGSLNKVSIVSIRSLISMIVEPDEAAKIFTVITALDCYTTLGASFLYTTIFKVTIDTGPGLVFKVVAMILSFPVFTCVWLELTRGRWEPKPISKSETKSGKPVENKELAMKA